MITKEQMERAICEFTSEALMAFEKARAAERSLEAYDYQVPRGNYSPQHRDKLLEAYRDADYMAESRAVILGLLERADSIPYNAVCFFKDGDRWCCVHGDFIDLQQSPAGFGETFEEALDALQKSNKTAHPILVPSVG